MGTLVEIASILLSGQTTNVRDLYKSLDNRTTYMALMELISKPKSPPPITAMAVMP
jgi:hypothetical protein